MILEKINKIDGHKIFRAFSWPSELESFGSKNVIYGWNGTGKSTLSETFRNLQNRDNIQDGEVEWVINGEVVRSDNLDENLTLPVWARSSRSEF